MNDFAFELHGHGLQLIVSVMQRRIAVLDFGQHGIEPVDQPANFVAVKFLGSNFVAFCCRNHSHRIFKMQNRPGNQFLKFGRHEERKEAGDQHKTQEDTGVSFGP